MYLAMKNILKCMATGQIQLDKLLIHYKFVLPLLHLVETRQPFPEECPLIQSAGSPHPITYGYITQ